MAKLKNLLRCYAMGMGIKSISSAFHLSRNTVRKYVRKYQESGLTMEQMLSMSEDKLQDLFLDSKNMFSLHRHITRTVCGFLPAGRRTSDHIDASAFKNFTVFAFLMEKTIRDKRIFRIFG